MERAGETGDFKRGEVIGCVSENTRAKSGAYALTKRVKEKICGIAR